MQGLWENMDVKLHNDLKVGSYYICDHRIEGIIPKEVKKAAMTRFHWKDTTNKEVEATEK